MMCIDDAELSAVTLDNPGLLGVTVKDVPVTTSPLTREEMYELYGKPVPVSTEKLEHLIWWINRHRDLTANEAVAFGYTSQAAADVWARLNFERHGHVLLGTVEESDRFFNIYDIRAAIEALKTTS